MDTAITSIATGAMVFLITILLFCFCCVAAYHCHIRHRIKSREQQNQISNLPLASASNHQNTLAHLHGDRPSLPVQSSDSIANESGSQNVTTSIHENCIQFDPAPGLPSYVAVIHHPESFAVVSPQEQTVISMPDVDSVANSRSASPLPPYSTEYLPPPYAKVSDVSGCSSSGGEQFCFGNGVVQSNATTSSSPAVQDERHTPTHHAETTPSFGSEHSQDVHS